jgi:hypothetical protein
VNAGPVVGTPQTNIGYVTLTVCVPGTSTCQTIPNVQADTGSEGLRVISSVLTLSLPQENDGNGNPIGECAQFADGNTWGPVMMADVQMGGETASNIPIEVIGGPNVGSAPSACTSTGSLEQTVAALGANGLVGIGPFLQDCGSGCTSTGSSNPGFYFSCPSSGCSVAPASLAQQVLNPVALFASDNNGTIIELPSISSAGAATVTGSLVFGIGTEANNGLGNATVFPLDNVGNFTTTFKNTPYNMSFIDSGSNGIFFLDSKTTGLPDCTSPGNPAFYCPASTANLSAINSASNGASNTVNFSIANASSLNGNFSAFNDLGGSNPNTFDWGLPFFYGRNVFTGIEGQNSPAGVGPFFAY